MGMCIGSRAFAHERHEGPAVSGSLGGLLDWGRPVVPGTGHALIHVLLDNGVILTDGVPGRDIVDPRPYRLFPKEEPTERHLLQCHFSTELDVR